jgi:hypothetical protein
MMPVKPTGVHVLVMATLAGFVAPADTRADCPELEQLQRAYFDASEHIPPNFTKSPWGGMLMPSPPSRELCDSYRRLSETTKAWVEYARQHDELCRLSGLLPMMEREYLRDVEARDNVCAGRPPRPGFSIFPAERGIRR